MALPRKIFRIETMVTAHSAPAEAAPVAEPYQEIMRELGALRAMIAASPPTQSAADSAPHESAVRRLQGELRIIYAAIRGPADKRATENGADAPAARILDELAAVVQQGENATQKILAAAEDIDQAANNLSAALKDGFELGLAQDIRDRVTQVFEACNFQDLSCQRISKVMATFAGLERQIAEALAALAELSAAPPLHGPRLQGDAGHVTQGDVDLMFAGDPQE